MDLNGSNWIKVQIFPPPSPNQAQLLNLTLFRARAELNSEIPNYFEPEQSQARVLTLSLSRSSPAKTYGSSKLKVLRASFTLS